MLEPFFWGDSLPIPPLIGRHFRHGPSGTDGGGDCFALARDYFRMKGIVLPEFPRQYEWWEIEEGKANLLETGYLEAGFVRVTDPREGDGFLMKIPPQAPVYNHCGILVEDGLLLHHLRKRLSTREPAGVWVQKFPPLWVRYEGQ